MTKIHLHKKSLGQNFLNNPQILGKIADFARIEKTDTAVEVGPGEGTLTKFLLEKAKKVIAIEKDDALAEQLKQKFQKEILDGKLEIINKDVLDFNTSLPEPRYVLVGNIPYYITGALFKKVLEAENQPKSLTFVVQKEVAERILARDGKESILSISIKVYGTPEYGGIIKRGSFHPAPKVDSAIIAVRDISKERFLEAPPPSPLPQGEGAKKESARIFEKRFFEILRLGFSHKRKLLIKNLTGAVPRLNLDIFPLQKMTAVFKKCGIGDKARAEDLSVDDWLHLTKEMVLQ